MISLLKCGQEPPRTELGQKDKVPSQKYPPLAHIPIWPVIWIYKTQQVHLRQLQNEVFSY